MPTRKKSKGHIGFTATHEYFAMGKNIYRASLTYYVGTDGYRVGARFEATAAAWVHQAPRIAWIKTGRKR